MGITEEEWKLHMEKLFKSGAYRKIWNYFLELTRNENFDREIKEIRSIYEIPPDGFTETHDDPAYHILQRKLEHESIRLCKKYGFHFIPWYEEMIYYIMNNKTGGISGPVATEGALCILSDLANEAIEPHMKEIQEADALYYPLAVRISPYASERDILDFVKANYELLIKNLQNYYAKLLPPMSGAKSRNEKIQERNDFIYRNRNLPHKEIKALVKQEFGVSLEYPYIGKILSRERKRRQKV